MHDTANIDSGSPDDDTLGGRLLRARDAAGLTLDHVADRVGVERDAVQAWENDRAQPDADQLRMLAGLVGVGLSWFLHGIGDGPSEDERDRLIESMSLQLERLKHHQIEGQKLAARLESDMRRLSAASIA